MLVIMSDRPVSASLPLPLGEGRGEGMPMSQPNQLAQGATAGRAPSAPADGCSSVAQGATAGLSSSVGDAQLLAQAVAGDPAAFDQLVTIHQVRIARLVQRLLGWAGEIEDVVQDVFVDALKNLRRFDGRSSVLTWLTRIAINRCRTYQRKQYLRRKFFQWRMGGDRTPPLPPREGRGEGAVLPPLPLGKGWGEGAEEALIQQETIHQVHAALGQLKQSSREVIVLRYLEEQSIEEIARTLNLPRGTVDVRLTRARQQLEKILKPHFEP